LTIPHVLIANVRKKKVSDRKVRRKKELEGKGSNRGKCARPVGLFCQSREKSDKKMSSSEGTTLRLVLAFFAGLKDGKRGGKKQQGEGSEFEKSLTRTGVIK